MTPRRKVVAANKLDITIEFLRPDGDYSLPPQEGIFPPTIVSDAVYSKGVLLYPDSVKEHESKVLLACSYNYVAEPTTAQRQNLQFRAYNLPYPYDETTVPVLTPQEVQLWNHKRAAKSAAERHWPMPIYRLLGTITREVTVDDTDGPWVHVRNNVLWYLPVAPKNMQVKQRKMPIQMALKEAKAEQGVTTQFLQGRATSIQTEWNQKAQDGPKRQGWDQHGQLPQQAVNDKRYIPLWALKDWLKHHNVVDDSPTHKSLYGGLRSIPIDLLTVIDSLTILSSAEELYRVPLILPVAIVDLVQLPSTRHEPVAKKPRIDSNRWKIRIGVYANRLLPEVMTSHDLHICMTALDPGSYRVVEPLHIPSSPQQPVFESAPLPVVVTNDDGNDGDSDEEEKKRDTVDETIGDSTRDESRISAFSVKGFLKLLESKGNDISNWTSIEPKLAPVLKLKLMLHQQHAICWMLKMESLAGFGINSILWEERQFLDGGLYYYSPALGQIRLAPPPVMKGGILADEQGLGKTLEVLGLIATTLDELKREACETSPVDVKDALTTTHATLVVVPPALVTQWQVEVRKAVGDELDVDYFDARTATFEKDDGHSDIVITTYAALQNNQSSRFLSSFKWGRVVLDEMQEVRSSTTKIAKNCDGLVSQRRWMLSGTPLFDGIGDLRGELNFLRLEPYAAALEDGFFDFSVTSHWVHKSPHGLEILRILGLLILRRSKSMTILETRRPLLGLKPLTVEFVPVTQAPSERALYCFLEAIVSRALEGDGEKSSLASRTKCLRLLRELCITAILISGGIGLSSQLSTLNGLMISLNRREMALKAASEGTATSHGRHTFPFNCHASTFSCDEAIRYLSAAHEGANVGDAYVSTLTMGLGGGLSNRNRAAEDFRPQLQEAEDTLSKISENLEAAKSKKAKSLWHLALELVTTGRLPLVDYVNVKPSYTFLWTLRSLTIATSLALAPNIPALLLRGWRPATLFVENDLFERRPGFAWAHPLSYQLTGIPSYATADDIMNSVIAALGSDATSSDDERLAVISYNSEQQASWRAILQFSSPTDRDAFEKKTASSNGIALACKDVSSVQAVIDSIKANLDEALAEYKVLPSTLTQTKLAAARKEHSQSLLGLCIRLRTHGLPFQIRAAHARGPCRSIQPLLYAELLAIESSRQHNYDQEIRESSCTYKEVSQRLAKLRRILNHQAASGDIRALTVFETLCALSDGEKEKTKCPICLCNLGVSLDSATDQSGALVAMTNCGHLFCAECLKDYGNNRLQQGSHSMVCPSCRRAFDRKHPVLLVDPDKTSDRDEQAERREQAKSLVQRVAQLLDESNGQLKAEVWEELYLSIDLPAGADCSRHSRLNAIPGDFLAHLRAATKMHLAGRPTDMPVGDGSVQAGLSSKIRALLADLPPDDRSVVFTESKSAVVHLMTVFTQLDIGCRALFSQQAISDAEVALRDWKSGSLEDGTGKQVIPFPVLVVQAGAAASGLTLTAACKMFILEPFSRMEEEHQAYARCHRYGQLKPVHIKCYYAPFSVESRLLEWRKRATGTLLDRGTQVVCSVVSMEEVQPVDTQEDEVEQTRTNFLLGLTGDESNA